ncbi:TIGR04452 family lipoprotein [Leptospira interrogans]|uniref:TIGR04452 family lipoprotein n=3 Tax=Leptospira interrogans TaxID=173 RepID=UPI0004A28C95|nr:TIGR04452 family lipoprotein [Leptospira interrogans]
MGDFFNEKKIIIFLIPFLLLTNCFLFDTAGFSVPDAVSGKEAKDQILTSALIGAAISPDDTAVLALLAPELAKVEEDRYYNKADVDDCANFAMIINLVTINIGGFTCNLEPREYIFKYVY